MPDSQPNHISDAFSKMSFDPPEWAQGRDGNKSMWTHDAADEMFSDDEEEDTLVDGNLGIETVASGDANDSEVRFTTEKLKELYADAMKHKEVGNAAYRKSNHSDAVEHYRSAIKLLPAVPPRQDRPIPPSTNSITEITDEEAAEIEAEGSKAPQIRERDEVEDGIRDLTATCCTNMAVCLAQQKEYAQAVQACKEALAIDPKRWKALQKRAECNALLDTHLSLQDALDDYTTLSEKHPDASQRTLFSSRMNALRPKAEEAQRKETERMMAELKGYGNKLLGMFGMSLDNFKQTEGGGWTYQSNT